MVSNLSGRFAIWLTVIHKLGFHEQNLSFEHLLTLIYKQLCDMMSRLISFMITFSSCRKI